MGSTELVAKVQKKQRKVSPCFTVFVAVLAATLLLCSIYHSFEPNLDVKKPLSIWYEDIFKNIENLLPFRSLKSPPPVILLWTKYFSSSNWLSKLKSKGCKYECNITDDRRFYGVSSTVVFHLRDVNVRDLPEEKPLHQKWILFNQEAPPNTPPFIVQTLNGKIDWAVTYRTDSDIFTPYGQMVKTTVPNSINSTEGSSRKEYLVCWIVSNSGTSSRRESYVKILKSYIPVSIYGRSGSLRCPTENVRECYQHIASKCKFYLSFENSLCKDYITEKAFYALETDMVPVVMGGANYTNHLPPKSFINALDFREPKDLAAYLQELDADDVKFQQYHRWKSDYYVQDNAYRWACDLCNKLYSTEDKSFPRTDLQTWWFDEAKCVSWLDYFDRRL